MSLYEVPADGSGVPERLTTADAGTSHWPGSWSPDGQTLLFNVERARATDWDIWTLSGSDRETQSLYDTPDTLYLGAELSPNGEWLAYGAGPVVLAVDVYVEPFPPTGARHRISQNGGYWPLWSPDGDRLFYRPAATRGGITLRSVDVVTDPEFAFTNEQTLPIEGFTVVAYYRDYDLTPDGERFVMVFPADRTEGDESSRPQINVVLNWTKELLEARAGAVAHDWPWRVPRHSHPRADRVWPPDSQGADEAAHHLTACEGHGISRGAADCDPVNRIASRNWRTARFPECPLRVSPTPPRVPPRPLSALGMTASAHPGARSAAPSGPDGEADPSLDPFDPHGARLKCQVERRPQRGLWASGRGVPAQRIYAVAVERDSGIGIVRRNWRTRNS